MGRYFMPGRRNCVGCELLIIQFVNTQIMTETNAVQCKGYRYGCYDENSLVSDMKAIATTVE